MILEVLEEEEPAVFSQELFNTLSHYYEEILGTRMAGAAGGRPKPKNFTVFSHTQNAQCIITCYGDSEVAGDAPQAPGPAKRLGGKHDHGGAAVQESSSSK